MLRSLVNFYHQEDHLCVENGEDESINQKDVVAADMEAPLQRNIGPATDEEAYAPDEKALQFRNSASIHHEDAPLLRNNESAYDKVAVAV